MVTPRCFLPATRFVIAPVLLRNEATPPIFPPAKLLKEKKREEGNEVIGSQFRRNVLFFFVERYWIFFNRFVGQIRSGPCVYFTRISFDEYFSLLLISNGATNLGWKRFWLDVVEFSSRSCIYTYFEMCISNYSRLFFLFFFFHGRVSKDRKETFVIEMKGDAKDRPSWGFWWDG